jgi:hypothetical protein
MGWSRIVAGFVAVVAAVGIVTTSSGIAVAGNGTGSGGVNVDIYVHGANAPTVMSGLTFELFEFDGTTVGTDVASLCDPDDNPPPPQPVYAETDN